MVYPDLLVLVSLLCQLRLGCGPHTFLLSIGSLRRNLAHISLFFCLSVTFLLLAIGAWSGSAPVNKAGGAFGIVTAWIAYYCGLSDLLVKDESWFGLPLGKIQQENAL